MYGGRPEEVTRHVLASNRFITSNYLIEELVRNISKRRPKTPRNWLVTLRRALAELSKQQTITISEVSRDINDDPIVALALEYGAIIVTGDKDLLEYPHKKPPVLTIADYQELFMK